MDFDIDAFMLHGMHGTATDSHGIEQVRKEAAQDNSRLKLDVEQLESRLGRLQLACRAMSEILTEHLQLPPETIVERIQDIELRMRERETAVVNCPICDRLSRASRNNCLYCGEPLPPNDTSDTTT